MVHAEGQPIFTILNLAEVLRCGLLNLLFLPTRDELSMCRTIQMANTAQSINSLECSLKQFISRILQISPVSLQLLSILEKSIIQQPNTDSIAKLKNNRPRSGRMGGL